MMAVRLDSGLAGISVKRLAALTQVLMLTMTRGQRAKRCSDFGKIGNANWLCCTEISLR